MQEISSGSEASEVDDEAGGGAGVELTLFQGSVEAGVSADSCAYGKINKIYSRYDKKELRNLHEQTRSKSFCDADWRSTRATRVEVSLE